MHESCPIVSTDENKKKKEFRRKATEESTWGFALSEYESVTLHPYCVHQGQRNGNKYSPCDGGRSQETKVESCQRDGDLYVSQYVTVCKAAVQPGGYTGQ